MQKLILLTLFIISYQTKNISSKVLKRKQISEQNQVDDNGGEFRFRKPPEPS